MEGASGACTITIHGLYACVKSSGVEEENTMLRTSCGLAAKESQSKFLLGS